VCTDRDEAGLCSGDSRLCYEHIGLEEATVTAARTTATTPRPVVTGTDGAPVTTTAAADNGGAQQQQIDAQQQTIEALQQQVDSLTAVVNQLLNAPERPAPAQRGCGDDPLDPAPCAPAVVRGGDADLTLRAGGGTVVIESKDCGRTDLCELSRDVHALLAKFEE